MAYGILLPGGLVRVPRSSPALPVWTYTSGAVASGSFTTNEAIPFSTTIIIFSEESKYGPVNFVGLFSHMTIGSIVYLTRSSGVCAVFRLISAASSGTMAVEILASPPPEEQWSGDYQVVFIPTPDVTEVTAASGITPFTGILGTPSSMDINTGIVTNAT